MWSPGCQVWSLPPVGLFHPAAGVDDTIIPFTEHMHNAHVAGTHLFAYSDDEWHTRVHIGNYSVRQVIVQACELLANLVREC